MMDPIAITAIVFSALALAASLTGLRYSKESVRIAKESNGIAQKIYESDNLPKISMSLAQSMVILDEEVKTQAFTPVLSAVVKNEGKIPVTFTQAYVAKQGAEDAYGFDIVSDNSDIKASLAFPTFPYVLGTWQKFEVPASGDTLAKMLPMLRAEPDDMVVFRVMDTLGNRYDTDGWRAGEYMQKRRMRITRVSSEEGA